MKSLTDFVQNIRSSILRKVPSEHKEEFQQELLHINLSRIKFFSVVLSGLLVLLVIRDLHNLNIPPGTGRLTLLYVHIIFLLGMLCVSILIFTIWPDMKRGFGKWHQLFTNIFAAFVILMCTVISFSYPFGVVSIYILGCFGVANIIYMHVPVSFIVYTLAHLVFIIGHSYYQDNPYILWAYYVNGTLTVIVAWGISILTYNMRVKDFVNHKTIEFLSYRDSLTGIPNRRQFNKVINSEWGRSMCCSTPLSLIIADIDFFKTYNDAYGHLAGDRILKQVADTLLTVVKRSNDFVARFGGEEFIIILPNTGEEGAFVVAEKLRMEIENLMIPHIKSPIGDYLTISLGIATSVPHSNISVEILIEKADQALYIAKGEGRNRVVTAKMRL